MIAVLYVVMLSAIGLLMLFESLRTYFRGRNPQAPRGKLHTHYLVHRLPWKMRFYKSKLYISAFLPIGLGFAIGILSAILGVGGSLDEPAGLQPADELGHGRLRHALVGRQLGQSARAGALERREGRGSGERQPGRAQPADQAKQPNQASRNLR